MKVSDYTILGKNKDEDYILIHSYLGNIDILEKKYGDILVEYKKRDKEIDKYQFPENIYNSLIKKHYLVDDKNKDKKQYKKIANKISEINAKKYSAYTIIPSYECNFRCSYCFELDTVSKQSNNIQMSTQIVDEIFKDVDNDINQEKKVEITLFGGEPLLKKNININKYILQKAKKRNIKVSAISNGYELDYYLDIFKNDYFDSIQITLDGNEKVHNSRRYLINKLPTFSKILQNIDSILKIENGPKISVRVNVDKHNYDSVIDLYNIFKSKEWTENKKFDFYTKSVHACYAEKDEKVFDSDVVENVKLSDDNLTNMNFNISYRRMISDIKNTFDVKNKLGVLRTCSCGAVNGMKVIDAYGDIYACYEDVDCRENRIGYIDIKLGAMIYNNKKTEWRNRYVQNLNQCSKCSYSLVCGGNCPKHTKVTTGHLYKSCCEDKQKIYNRVLLELAPTL
ncbi:radical SAM protein [Clostridium botulinum]|uniref:radical SAM/SPASM domain-containing protein n=1 Tax=Clostridium botulinum TaxID=1491 RepID=UPI001788C282|nr:radical SAM protein [Clostridium botulinum]MBE1303416.1 radical SAM protein [Clostridium botulinum]